MKHLGPAARVLPAAESALGRRRSPYPAAALPQAFRRPPYEARSRIIVRALRL